MSGGRRRSELECSIEVEDEEERGEGMRAVSIRSDETMILEDVLPRQVMKASMEVIEDVMKASDDLYQTR